MCEKELTRLEDSLSMAVERLKSLQTENAELRRKNRRLTENLEELEGERRKDVEKLGRLQDQRSAIRSRLQRINKNLDALEDSQP